MAGRWRQWEVTYLHDHAGYGAQSIADRLGRTVQAVERQASRYGVSLRRRWYCPKCSREVYSPLSEWSGWCRRCSIAESKDRASVNNRRVRAELQEERRKVRQAERERQALYSDTHKKRKELRRLRESRQVDVNKEGDKQ